MLKLPRTLVPPIVAHRMPPSTPSTGLSSVPAMPKTAPAAALTSAIAASPPGSNPAMLYAKVVRGVTSGRTRARTAATSGLTKLIVSDLTLESFEWISVQMLSISPRAERTAAFSSAEMGVAGLASAELMVEAVAFILVAIVVRWFLIAGPAVVAFELARDFMLESSVETEPLRLEMEPVTVVIEMDFLTEGALLESTDLTVPTSGRAPTVLRASVGRLAIWPLTPATVELASIGAARTRTPRLRETTVMLKNFMLTLGF